MFMQNKCDMCLCQPICKFAKDYQIYVEQFKEIVDAKDDHLIGVKISCSFYTTKTTKEQGKCSITKGELL